MRKLRRTLSFRSRSKYRANNNPANWENDSINIKHGGLSFSTKVSMASWVVFAGRFFVRKHVGYFQLRFSNELHIFLISRINHLLLHFL